jgi:5-methylcytosine-specific restriction protein A
MLKSCQYCGLTHQRTETCPRKPSRKKKLTESDRFRNQKAWRQKSKEIRQRDKGLCQICIRLLHNTQQQYTFDTIGVHHICPLHEDMSRGLDNKNLISVCEYHHHMCETGEIKRVEQFQIAGDQERKNNI